ncbi:MAG TPA: hypothetical protein PKW98_05220 [Candidatus Wallbacteria bacterium]|nr:MAG: hypothetical protein BWY32_00145 [bacterium ADurb.Bin243]HOD39108.1 hypothetical protein [Candidatus Wallbacteria bacterium]HPG57197.1 hypothetical protein [Candidatus Wallbacteria bacterium]
MNPVLKPKIFNDESVLEASGSRPAEKKDEVRAAMLRAEKMSKAARIIAMTALCLLLIKDAPAFPFAARLSAVSDLWTAAALIRDIIYYVFGVLFSNKLYYFSLLAALWFVADRPSLFLPLFAESFSAAYKKGLRYMQKEKYELAIEKFNKALNNFISPSEQIKIRTALSECYYTMSLYDECIKNSLEILDLDGANPAAQSYIGRSFLEKKDRSDLAVKYYIYLFNSGFYDKRLMQLLSAHFLDNNDMSETAVEVYKKIYESSVENYAVREMVYKSCVIVNDRSAYALKLYEDIASDEPSRRDVKFALTEAYYESKNFKKTAETIQNLFAQGEISLKLLERFTEAMEKLGRRDALAEEFKALIEKHPDNIILRDYYNSMKSLFIAGRLVQGESSASAGAGRPAARKINICANCAHMNPAGISHCEKCRSALQAI